MMNVEMARKNVENYNNKVVEKREERVNKFLETTVNAEIEQKSRDGYDCCKVTAFVDKEDTELAMKKIEELGFEVELFHNRFIFIEW